MAAESFLGVRVQGGLIPAELLSRIAAGGLDGQSSADYHLAPGETVREAANRAWSYLTGVWVTYRQAAERLPESDRGTTPTRERWLLILLRELGFGWVSTAPSGGLQVDGKHAPVSHLWEHVPIHLLGHRVELDRRTRGVAGAATSSPQSMVQELLNRSDEHLWALLSNGLTLRLLRDSTSLVGSSYVEFDLETIFDGDLFADFLLMFSLCHESRLQVRDPEKGAASCWLETWRTNSIESGSRALDQLRDGVIDAINTLGTGFLAHPANAYLRDKLADATLRIDDVNHALLRVVYRLLFTFVAEDRGLLLSPDADAEARERYSRYFSTARLRRTARRRRGTRHTDQWRALGVVWGGLGSEHGRPELGLVGIGGIFDPGPLDVFHDAELSNEALFRVVRQLSLVVEPGSGMKRVVDYRNLGAEELGSIYETLLEFVPSWDAGTRTYSLRTAAGNDRKSTGSYYTPTSLIDCLLDSALDPVLDRAEQSPEPESALLRLTVCDPACGSGHFLVAAARRIAKRVAAIRTGDPEPPPERVREALTDVVGRCIYGVDVNPLAAELAKVSLWLETLDPGRPLAFLDAQIKVGNSLMGTTPGLIAGGVPDEAFTAIEGDDKKIVTALKKQNKAERSGQDELFAAPAPSLDASLAREVEGLIGSGGVTSLADVHARQKKLTALESDPAMRRLRLVADAWCAAFVWPKRAGGPKAVTDGFVKALERGEVLPTETAATVQRLGTNYKFFHWHVEFPHLFRPSESVDGPGWEGGFDVVLGNPPWERVKLQEQEFFAARDPEIASAPNAAARKRLIKSLAETDPVLFVEYGAALRRAGGESHFLRNSGRFSLTGRGDINTYAVFAEGSRNLIAPNGRMGMILPTGIATDATTQHFFKDLVQSASLASLYDFENAKPLFQGVHRSFKFCLLTLSSRAERVSAADFAFFAHDPSDLLKDDARFELTPEEIQLLNPNTGTCPIFRTRRDAEITLGIYRRVPVLMNEHDPVNGNPWGIGFMRMFDMSNDSHLFHTRDELEADGWTLNGNVFERPLDGGGIARMLPLYEAKMIHLYDTRWATYDVDESIRDMTEREKASQRVPLPRYWVKFADVEARWGERKPQGPYFAWRGIARTSDVRTAIGTLMPTAVPAGGNFDMVLGLSRSHVAEFTSAFSSFAFDFTARQKLSNMHLQFSVVKQLPFPPPGVLDALGIPLDRATTAWVALRVDRLNGWISDTTVRAQVRAELDGLMFHVYGLERSDVSYVLDTFPIVKRKDEAEFGTYRTKDLILAAYDSMAEAKATGMPYRAPWTREVAP